MPALMHGCINACLSACEHRCVDEFTQVYHQRPWWEAYISLASCIVILDGHGFTLYLAFRSLSSWLLGHARSSGRGGSCWLFHWLRFSMFLCSSTSEIFCTSPCLLAVSRGNVAAFVPCVGPMPSVLVSFERRREEYRCKETSIRYFYNDFN